MRVRFDCLQNRTCRAHLFRIISISVMDALNACSLVKRAANAFSLLAHCRRYRKAGRCPEGSRGGSEPSSVSSSEKRRTPSVRTATMWSTNSNVACRAEPDARQLVRRCSEAKMMPVFCTSSCTRCAILGVSCAAAM